MKKILAILFSYVALGASSHADTHSAQDLNQLLQNLHSMEANFTQTTHAGKGKVTRTTGKMYMQKPGRFRWDIKKPMPQLIVANQKTLWIYDPDLTQVTIRKFQYEAGEAPALLLSHENNTVEKNFNVSVVQKKSNEQWYNLTPKKSDGMYEKIQLGVSNGAIQKMALTDNLGHQTAIEFSQVKTNTSLQPGLFQFKTPRGVDVIDERKK